MEVGTVSLVISGLVAAMQFLQYIENKNVRKEQSLNVYAKAEIVSKELDAIRAASDTKLEHLRKDVNEHDDEIQDLKTRVSVSDERLINVSSSVSKVIDKLDDILESKHV